MALNWMRRHKKKMYIVMVFAMAAWGIGYSASYLIPKKPIGTIMGEKISAEEFNDAMVRWHRVFLQQQDLPLGKLVWEQLALVKEAERMGIVVSNDEIIERIKTLGVTMLGRAGMPVNQILRLLCQDYMVTEEQLLRTYKEALLIEKMHVLISGSVKIPNSEVRGRYAIENEEVKVEFVAIRALDLAKNVSVTDEEITSFYNTHKDSFPDPSKGIPGYKEAEKIKIEYLMARYRDVKKKVMATEDEMQAYYEEHKDTKYKKAETPKGHETKESQPPQYKPFEEVKNEIQKTLEREKAKQLVNELINNADESIYERLGRTEQISFADIGGDVGIFYKESDYFTREEAKNVIKDADEAVYSKFFERENYDPSPPLDAPAGKFTFQVISIKEPSAPPLQTIREKVVKDLKEEKALARAKELAQRFIEKTKQTSFEDGLKSLNDECKGADFAKKETEFFKRPEMINDRPYRYIKALEANAPNVARSASKLREGELDVVTEETGKKAVYIIRLTEKKEADQKKFEEDKGKLAQKYLLEKQQDFIHHWAEGLKRKAKLTK
ncbi:MAG: SurA N-terminal domain-containing protein [Candidatus Brocadiales bacterium]